MNINRQEKDLQNIFQYIKETIRVGLLLLEELLLLLTYLLYQMWVEKKIKPENKYYKRQKMGTKNER